MEILWSEFSASLNFTGLGANAWTTTLHCAGSEEVLRLKLWTLSALHGLLPPIRL